MTPTDDQRRAYAEALAKVKASEPRKTWLDWAMLGEPRPYEITAVASVLSLDPEALWDHVGGIHGWEPHDVGYEDAVWAAAACDDPEHLKGTVGDD